MPPASTSMAAPDMSVSKKCSKQAMWLAIGVMISGRNDEIAWCVMPVSVKPGQMALICMFSSASALAIE